MQKNTTLIIISVILVISIVANIALGMLINQAQAKVTARETLLKTANKAIQDILRLASVGRLGDIHIHADVAVYIDGQMLDFSKAEYQLQHSFVHFEDGRGDVVHMHAPGITLAHIMNSVNTPLTNECITVDGEKHCNSATKKLTFMVNGVEQSEKSMYVFNDLDRILISYGDENEVELKAQMDSVTSNADEIAKGLLP
jgi:hypothetical protein